MGKEPSLRAVLLDVDGTLIDSNDAHAAAWSDACGQLGYDLPRAFFRPLIGMGGDQILRKIEPNLSPEADPGRAIVERRAKLFLQRYLPLLAATPGARALTQRLKDDRLSRVVASSAKSDELDALLAVVGIADLIDLKTTSDDADRSKPAPDIIQAALEKAGISAHEAIMLGDTPYDIRSAERAGVSTVALRCGGWDASSLTGAIAIYEDPADLLARFDTSPFRSSARR